MTSTVLAPTTRIAAQERAIERARDDERAANAGATRCMERLQEVEERIAATEDQRRREKLRAEPSPDAFAKCDAELDRLALEREAAHDAHAYAAGRVEAAKQQRVDEEEKLRALHRRVERLRDGIPEARRNIVRLSQQISEVEHNLELLRARKAADEATLASAEKELVDLVGPVTAPAAPEAEVASRSWFGDRVVWLR